MVETTTYRRVTGQTVVPDEETTYLPSILKRTSWGAVIAGAVVAISSQMLLTVLGIALGATVTEVNGRGADARTVGMGAAVWWLVTGTLSLFLGGCVVGRFGGMTRGGDVLLHGLTMWGVAALFGFLAVTTGAGALYGSSMNAVYGPPGDATRGAFVERSDTGERTVGDRASGAVERDLTPEEARRYTAKASWWTLGGLLLGIGASLLGSWLCAPERIVLRSPSEARSL